MQTKFSQIQLHLLVHQTQFQSPLATHFDRQPSISKHFHQSTLLSSYFYNPSTIQADCIKSQIEIGSCFMDQMLL